MERKIIEYDKPKVLYKTEYIKNRFGIDGRNNAILNYCVNCEQFYITEYNDNDIASIINNKTCENCNIENENIIKTTQCSSIYDINYYQTFSYCYMTRLEYDEFMCKINIIKVNVSYLITRDEETNEIKINSTINKNNIFFSVERIEKKTGKGRRTKLEIIEDGEKIQNLKKNFYIFNNLLNFKELFLNCLSAKTIEPSCTSDLFYDIYKNYKENPELIGTPLICIKDKKNLAFNTILMNCRNKYYKDMLYTHIDKMICTIFKELKQYNYSSSFYNLNSNNIINNFPTTDKRYYDIKEITDNTLRNLNHMVDFYFRNSLYELFYIAEYTDEEIYQFIRLADIQNFNWNAYSFIDAYKICKNADIPFQKIPKDFYIYIKECSGLNNIITICQNRIDDEYNKDEYEYDINKILHQVYYNDINHKAYKVMIYLYKNTNNIDVILEKATNEIKLIDKVNSKIYNNISINDEDILDKIDLISKTRGENIVCWQ